MSYKPSCVCICSLMISHIALMEKWLRVAILLLRFWFQVPGSVSVLVIIGQTKHFVF